MARNNIEKNLRNKLLIERVSSSSSVEDLSSAFEIVNGLAKKIRANISAILMHEDNFIEIRNGLVSRLQFLDELGIDIDKFFQFFESTEYWNLEYDSIQDHVNHTNNHFPKPIYYSARQFVDYDIFPTYFLRKQAILKKINASFEESDKLHFLEAGVGSGELSSEILKQYPYSKGVGCDVINENLTFTNYFLQNQGISSLRFKTLIRNIEDDLGLIENSFDLIICSEVLEHLKSPELALQEFFRVLKQDGKIIITVPLNDPGHEHIQNFKTSEDFIKTIPSGLLVFDCSIEEWSGYQINTHSGDDNSDSIQHLLIILKKNG